MERWEWLQDDRVGIFQDPALGCFTEDSIALAHFLRMRSSDTVLDLGTGNGVLCLYALKYLKERKIPLRYPVRALLGVNEEIGMKDVEYYLENFPAPLFCFSPDADFLLCI